MISSLRFLFTVSVLLGAAALQVGCQASESDVDAEGPRTVTIEQIDGQYQLFVNGEPYFIKGAGVERQPPGEGDIEELAARGANSMRTWRTDEAGVSGQEILDRAHEAGLTVTMGLEVARERHGFDYDDSVAVAQQFEEVKAEVLKYRDHPALIIWAIGNELNLRATNPRVWDAVNDLSEMIHELDPNHLTTTTLAGISGELVEQIEERAPDLDLLSIQMYADLPNLPRYIDETGWEGPYMVTEWGATGHWEVATTPWGAPIENNSSVKADSYLERHGLAIASDTTQLVGSYVFLWGQKQERTPTWYGLFLPSGEATETVDVMQYIWTGEWPQNRSPRLEEARLDGKTAYEGIYLEAGASYPAMVRASDPDGDSLRYEWEVMPESTDLGDGGDFESTPESLEDLVIAQEDGNATLTAPETAGAYRLFTYVYDGNGNAAHVNIPFHVD